MNLLVKVGAVSMMSMALSYAQPSPPAPGQPVGGTVLSGSVQLSYSEQLSQATILEDQTRADQRHVIHLLDVARKEKDSIKLNCVSDKMVQIKPKLNIFDKAKAALIANGGTSDSRNSNFDEVSATASDIRRLREEADQCTGESTLAGVDGDVLVSAPDVPNPNVDIFDPDIVDIEPPGYASPTGM